MKLWNHQGAPIAVWHCSAAWGLVGSAGAVDGSLPWNLENDTLILMNVRILIYVSICLIYIYTCRYILYIELDSSYLNPFDKICCFWIPVILLPKPWTFFLLKQFFGVCTCNYRELEGFAARKLHSLQQNPGSNCRSFGLCDCSWLWIFAHFLLDQSKNQQLQGFCADDVDRWIVEMLTFRETWRYLSKSWWLVSRWHPSVWGF